MNPSKPIKICFIDFFAYPLFNPKSKIVFGGAQIQLYLLAKELTKDKKNSVSFLTDNRFQNKVQVINNIKVYQFLRTPLTHGLLGRLVCVVNSLPLVGYLIFFTRLFIQIKKINADVYVQRAASAETGLIALISKLLNKKFIFMVAHSDDVDWRFIQSSFAKGGLYSLGLSLADQIICQTKQQQKLINQRLKFKSTVVPSGYPITKPKNQKKQTILWVARAETWKNPEIFLNLAKKFPRQKFTMICPPAENDPAYFNTIKKQAEQIKNLHFIKQVPFNQINTYFKKAKIFVSTSQSEGFPNTFIQAGKNKTPIISFKVNPDNIFTKHKIGVCANGDQKKLISLTNKILKTPKLYKKLSNNAYQYAAKQHHLNKTALSFKNTVLSIL